MSIKVRDIITLTDVTGYIKDAIYGPNGYLYHHFPMNENVVQPSVPGDWSFFPIKWCQTIQDYKKEIDGSCSKFESVSKDNIIDASDTYGMIMDCFWKACKIGAYRYSYYPTPTSRLITETHYGLKKQYFTNFKSYELSVNQTIYKNTTILSGEIISVDGFKTLVDNLIKFNKKQEIMTDYGQRNKIEEYDEIKDWYEHFPLDRGSCQSYIDYYKAHGVRAVRYQYKKDYREEYFGKVRFDYMLVGTQNNHIWTCIPNHVLELVPHYTNPKDILIHEELQL